MRRIFTLGVVVFAITGLTQLASAGPEQFSGKEMKSVVQPVMQPECNWTGFYLGAHVGYGWNDLKWSDTDPDNDGEGPGPEVLVKQSADGVIAGGTLGYNYQFCHHFVIGAEGEFSYSDVSASSSVSTESFRNEFETNSDWVGTVGLRLGFAWHHVLFFAKGGAAISHREYSLDHHVLDEPSEGNPVDRFTADDTRVAPLVGGGIEYMINCHWSVKVEYNAQIWGKEDIHGTNVEAATSFGTTGPEPETYEVDLKNQHSVRGGLNYRF
jgi:outer membrane immunogenic protein